MFYTNRLKVPILLIIMANRILINGSGSSGNNIVIDSNGHKLLVDLGVDYKTIMSSLCYDITNVSAALASHNHIDHVRCLDKFIHMGIPCYGNKDVCDAHNGCIELPKVLNVNGFKIQTFELVHNAPTNAFVIDTDDGIRILYCTDTKRIPKKVKGVHYAAIECNYDQDTIIDNEMEDVFTKSKPENHQSLDECARYLKAINNVNLQCIILWHMSMTNIDENKAIAMVKRELGFDNVIAANKGDIVELVKEEF